MFMFGNPSEELLRNASRPKMHPSSIADLAVKAERSGVVLGEPT